MIDIFFVDSLIKNMKNSRIWIIALVCFNCIITSFTSTTTVASTTTSTTVAPPSCLQYMKLRDGRRSTSYTTTDGNYMCDRELMEGWYRPMTGTGDNMPTNATNYGNCGTVFPIWYRGDLPALGETVTGDACVMGLFDDCEETIKIMIRNCSAYNLYYLKPTTSCYSAYCIGEAVACGPGYQLGGVFPNCTPNEATPLSSDPVLDWVVGELDTKLGTFKQVIFRCNVSTDGLDPDQDLVDLKFLIGDKVKKEFTGLRFDELPAQLYGVEDFDKKYNDDNKLAFNKMLRCDARTRRDDTGTTSATRSVEQFYGFKITSAKSFVLEEEEVAQIEIHLNLPVFEILNQSFINVELHIPTFFQKNLKPCSKGDLLIMTHATCSVKFDASHGPQTKRMQVIGQQQKIYFKPRQMIIKLASTRSENRHISDFPLEPISVTLVDKKRHVSNMICYAISDPRMRLFSGIRWDINESPTEFILYKHDTLKHEVQIKTERCLEGQATCPCSVIVRSGLSGYIMDTCGPRNRKSSLSIKYPPRIKMYDCADGQQDMEIEKTEANEYIFTFRTKTRIKVENDPRSGAYNVYVYPSVADIKSSGGVCGRITEVGEAKRFKRDGNIAIGDEEFANSWSVGPGERLFTEQDLTFTEPVYYCNCSGDDITCGVSPEHDQCINEHNSITGQENSICQQNKIKRKRRSAQPWKRSIGEQATVMEDDNGYIEYEEENGPIPEAVWHNGWTEDTAREYCENFMKNNPVTQACHDLVPAMQAEEEGAVNTCVMDIKVIGGTDAALIQLSSLLALCLMELEKDTDLWEPDPVTGEYTMPTAVTNSVCPSQCNGLGECINGTCVCSTGFSGADCSFNDTAVPEIFRLPQDGLCDLQDWTCSAIKVYAYDAYATPALKCKTTLYWVRESGMEEMETLESAGQWDRLYTVICLLPYVDEDKPNDVIGKLYKVSLSNDGVRYGNEGSMMVFDGYCVECSMQEEGRKCSLKDNVCTIGSSCYSDGEENPSESCQVCDLAVDRHAWTQKHDSCSIDGTCYLADEENPTNACQLCQPQQSMTSWTQTGTAKTCEHSGFMDTLYFPLVLSIAVLIIVGAVIIAVVCRWKRKKLTSSPKTAKGKSQGPTVGQEASTMAPAPYETLHFSMQHQS